MSRKGCSVYLVVWLGVHVCLRWSGRCALVASLRFVLVYSCVGASWSRWLVLAVMVLVAGWRCSWCSCSRRCGCACVCGPLTACLPCVRVLAWVWAVGRSGGLLWLLVVGCVWRMSSGPVVVGGVARACLCRVCVGGWFWWLWWCPGWGAGVGVHGGGGAVGGRRDRYPACQVGGGGCYC